MRGRLDRNFISLEDVQRTLIYDVAVLTIFILQYSVRQKLSDFINSRKQHVNVHVEVKV